jgi:hypothetical protein
LTLHRAASTDFDLFTVPGGATISISGLHLSGGKSSSGGAILNQGTLSLTDVEINGNRADGGGNGGGILNQGTLTVAACSIHGNTADGNGGGIENDGTLNLSRSLVSANNASGNGGGIAGSGGLTIADSTISSNVSIGIGGGLAISKASSTPTASITRSSITGNSAGGDGGGVFNQAQLTLDASTVANNKSTGAGGGLLDEGPLTVTNSTLALNSANLGGGGLERITGLATLTNVTVAANTSTGAPGGGIASAQSALTSFNNVKLVNTIVALNRRGSGQTTVPDDVLGTFSTASHANVIGVVTGSTGLSVSTNQVGTAITPLDPGLFPLADNGGPTFTMALQPGSRAIDTADSTAVASLVNDQRGASFGRVIGNQSNATARVDIGAFEFQDQEVGSPYFNPSTLGAAGPLSVRLTDNGSSLFVAGPTGYGFKIGGTWSRTITTSQAGGLTYTQETFTGTGNLVVESALGNLPLTLPGGQVQFVTAPHLNTTGGAVASTTLNGQIDLSSLVSRFTSTLDLGFTLPSFTWGLELGKDLHDLGAPLNDAMPYFFAEVNKNFAVSFGGTNLSLSHGAVGAVVFDPADPFVYFKFTDTQVGASFHGYIPFQPKALPTQAAAQNVQIFGHVLVGGSFDITKLGPFSMELAGDLLLDFDANDDGQIAHPDPGKLAQGGTGIAPLDAVFDFATDFAFGLNGTLSLKYKPVKFLTLLNLPLADGTLLFKAGSGAFLRAETANPFTGIGLDKVIPLQKYLGADLDGFISIPSTGTVHFDVDAHVHLGQNSLLGADVDVNFDDTGISLDATVDTFVGDIAVHGDIGPGHLNVSGSIDLGIDLSPLTTITAHLDLSLSAGTSLLISGHLSADATVNLLVGTVEFKIDLGLGFGSDGSLDKPLFLSEVTGLITVGLGTPLGGEAFFTVGVTFASGVLTVDLPSPLPNVTINFNNLPAFQNRTVTPNPIARGQSVTLSGVITEPDAGDSFELDVDWGDGTPTQVITVPPDPVTGTVDGLPVAVEHTYDDTNPSGLLEDIYPVLVRWRNPGGGFSTDTLFVTVQNPAPLVKDLQAQALGGEGQVAVSAVLPDLSGDLTAAINWGDGTSEVHTYAAGTPALNETHQYTGNGTYPIGVTLTSADDLRTPSTSVTVTDIGTNPAITGPDFGVRGQPLSYTLTAPGAGPFTFALDWNGDGTPDQAVTGPSGTQVTHVFTDAGADAVVLTASAAGGPVGTPTALAVQIATVAVEADPANLGQRHLVIGGSTGSDTITVGQQRHHGLRVLVEDGSSQQREQTRVRVPVSWVVVYAQGGDDVVVIQPSVKQLAEVFGDAGNDLLIGGGGNNILVGGAGEDHLFGGPRRDVLIGAEGHDLLFGNHGDDVLIGGTTAFDSNAAALRSILNEWTSDRTYQDRIANLGGTGSGAPFAARSNGDFFLTTTGPDATVQDDHAWDSLIGNAGTNWYFAALGGPDADLFPFRRPDERADGLS